MDLSNALASIAMLSVCIALPSAVALYFAAPRGSQAGL